MIVPSAVAALAARAAPGEAPLHCLPADLDRHARYQHGYTVVTASSILAIAGERADRYPRRPGDRIAAHVMTGSGMLLVARADGGDGGSSQAVAWFSRRHATAYLRLAAALGAAESAAVPDGDDTQRDGMSIDQRGGFARDWVAEPLRDPRGVLTRLTAFLRPQRGIMLYTLVLFAAANLLTLLIPQLTRILIDRTLVPRTMEPGPVALLLAAMAAAYVLRTGIAILRNRGVARLSSRLVHDLRSAVFTSVQAMSLRFIAAKPQGDMVNRVAIDTTNVRRFLESWGTDGVSQVLLFVLLCIVTFAQNWLLALLTISTIPLALLLAVVVWRLARWMERTHHRLHDKIGTFVLDVLAGIRVIKAFRRESAEVDRYRSWTARKYVIDVRNQKIWRVMGPLVEFATRLGELLVFLAGGYLVLAGQLSLGELVQFAAYVILLAEPLAWAGEVPQRLVEALTSSERIFETIDQQPEIRTAARPVRRTLTGEVEFQNVEFAYRPGEPVLSDFSLHLPAGDTTGLVGASGAGKSTVINLLLRLYDVDGGRILLDGTDLRALEPASLRSQVGVVLQDPFLFTGSVADNIRYAKARCHRCRGGARRAHRAGVRLRDAVSRWLRYRGRRARPAAVGRRAAAHLDRARHSARSAHPDSRRGDLGARPGDRGAHPYRARRAHQRAYGDRHRAPAGHPAPRPAAGGAGGRAHRRAGHPSGIDGRRRSLPRHGRSATRARRRADPEPRLNRNRARRDLR